MYKKFVVLFNDRKLKSITLRSDVIALSKTIVFYCHLPDQTAPFKVLTDKNSQIDKNTNKIIPKPFLETTFVFKNTRYCIFFCVP